MRVILCVSVILLEHPSAGSGCINPSVVRAALVSIRTNKLLQSADMNGAPFQQNAFEMPAKERNASVPVCPANRGKANEIEFVLISKSINSSKPRY